jgi:membrane-bound serine protease (ClpP class)
VSVPLVVTVGVLIGLLFLSVLIFALRALNVPISMGVESLIGKRGTARTSLGEAGGQVQLESELWTADPTVESESIGKGDHVEVVEVKGLRLKVRKIK